MKYHYWVLDIIPIIIKAIENNNAAYEDQFINEEELLRKTLGGDLGVKLSNIVTEIITVEKDSYKKLCTVFIDHHAEAIELLPFTINQITTAYIRCLSQVMLALQDKKEVETVSLQDNKTEEEQLSQYEALIEQLRSEKQSYSDKYKEIHNLLAEIYLKYKEELELKTVDTLQTKNLNEIAALFKLESVIFEDTENSPDMTGLELLTRIRNHSEMKQQRFFMVTAEADKALLLRTKHLHIDGYILKPFKIDVVKAKLDALFEQK